MTEQQYAANEELSRTMYLRHIRGPHTFGPAAEFRRLRSLAYEARAATAEGNPLFAASLLPATAPTAEVVGAVGMPLVPAGVWFGIDYARAGSVSVAVNVGGVGISVQAPGSAAVALLVTSGATRTTATFDAPADGLYTLLLTVAGVVLTPLYFFVTRVENGLFRQDNRYLRFAYKGQALLPSGTWLARLARLYGADALARTGRPDAAALVLASARALPAAPTPTALYPYHG